MKDKKSSSRPVPWLPFITGLSLGLLIFIAATRGGPSTLPAAETSAPPPRAAPAHTQRSEAPPPRPGEEVLAFNARQGRWQPAPLNDLKPGAEFIHKDRLFRIDPRLETIRRITEVDVHRLKAADANWDPTAKHRFPRVKDVVYVTKGDPRHTLLSHVRVGEELVFQGRIYKAKVRGQSLAIEATDQVLTEVTNTFKRPAHTLVDLDIAYLNNGASQRISGTPEHPFFVPAVDDYVPMGQLSPGTILRTEDGKQARVVGSKRRHGDFTVFNLEVAHAHNYFVSAPGSAAPGVLVHNSCYKPSGPMKGRKIGHTFDKHGSHNTYQLQRQAQGSNTQLGQWTDDAAAEHVIADNLGKLKNGTIIVPIPPGIGRVVMPNGTFLPATHAKLVPSKSGVKTAFPIVLE